MDEREKRREIADQEASIRGWRAQQQNKKYHAQQEDSEQRKQALINEIAGLEAAITDAENRIRALKR